MNILFSTVKTYYLSIIPALFYALSLCSTATYAKDETVSVEKAAAKVELSNAMTQQLLNEMIWVAGGTFEMGSALPSALNREKPAHQVTLDGFYMGKTEVTSLLWEEIMGWNYSYNACDNCAVNNISWKNVQTFITRLNRVTGLIFRLPSEAEWEFAAKGGNKSKGYLYSGSNNINDVAWFAANAKHRAHPVATKKSNELGLYDMTGNLWEFCMDDMNRTLYTKEPKNNPLHTPNKDFSLTSMKAIRGGGYDFPANESEVFRRDGATSNVRMPDIGFRLALSEK